MATEAQRAALRRHYAANKQYYKDKAARVKQELREFVREQKNVPCMDCGVQYPYYVMDFDHRPDEEKLYEPARLLHLGSKKKVVEELAKCDVVCSNCHRIRSWERLNG